MNACLRELEALENEIIGIQRIATAVIRRLECSSTLSESNELIKLERSQRIRMSSLRQFHFICSNLFDSPTSQHASKKLKRIPEKVVYSQRAISFFCGQSRPTPARH